MEVFFGGLLIIFIIGFIALVIITLIRVNSTTSSILRTIEELRKEVYKLRQQGPKEDKAQPVIPDSVIRETIVSKPVIITPEPAVERIEIKPPEKAIIQEKKATDLPPAQVSVTMPPTVEKKTVTPKPRTDIEKWIGEHLLSVIGIGVLVLGLVFFVKWAIDRELINETGRVAIGILSGGALIFLAHRLRHKYNIFSSVLVGGGLAVLYFTITIAFQNYHLFSQTVAFAIMAILTGFAVAISLAYNRQILAVIAMVGGFGTPFFVSTGEGNYIVLFTYLLILNAGMLYISVFKKWYWVNVVCFAFTALIYGGWLINQLNNRQNPPYAGAFIFGTLFYVVFFLMNLINNIRLKLKFSISEFTILILNTFLYFAAGMAILQNVQEARFQGLFTTALALYNFLFVVLYVKKEQIDKNLIYLLTGFVITFVTLAAPVQLNGNYITLFWAAESVFLLWFSQKSGLLMIKAASAVLVPLMLISLFLDWANLYVYTDLNISSEDAEFLGIKLPAILPVVFNEAFITGLAVSLSLYSGNFLLRFEQSVSETLKILTKIYKWILLSLFVVILYMVIMFEMNYQLWRFVEHYSARQVYTGAFHILFTGLLVMWAYYKKLQIFKEICMGIAVVSLLYYITGYLSCTTITRNLYISGQLPYIHHFLFHYLAFAAALLSAFWIYRTNIARYGKQSAPGIISLWAAIIIFIIAGSAEICNLTVLSLANEDFPVKDVLLQSRKIGFPVFWGLTSFALMFLGMKNRYKQLRIISLSLFALTLLKLFIWDIRGINEGGKVVAFVLLGILLLIVSFMYQKIKNLFFKDDETGQ